MKTRSSARVLLALAVFVSVGCGRPREPDKPVERARDVLLITIDTARADRFSYTGAPGPGTPHVDALARDGAGFTDAISPVPLTLPAHASLLTGRLPPSHTVRDNGSYRLPASETTLAEVLAGAGYTTAAFIGAEVLDARYGLDQGFATYDDEMPEPGGSPFLYYPERSGEQVAAAAVRWLDAQGQGPLFAWVHLFDPHVPYRPPEPERSQHASPYDGEIAYADRVVGQLVDRWATRRGLDRTVVVVASDHGEALGEHGESTHGVLVHEATLRVPLVIRAPGLGAAGAIREPVSLVDVLPTVLALVGLPAPPGVQGRDLGPLLRGGSIAGSRHAGYAESLYAELHHGCAPLHALRQGTWKLVRGIGPELYDVAADPREEHDMAGTEAARVSGLARSLDGLLAELGGQEAERVVLDEHARRALEALGYVWSTPAPGAASGPPRDPREALRSMRHMAEADRLVLQGDVAGAVAAYRAVIAAEPRSVDARVRLAQVLLASGRGAEAVPLLVEAVAHAPHEILLHRKLGSVLEGLGRYREAVAAYEAGLAVHPEERDLRNARWRCLNQLGRRQELLAETAAAVASDPRDGAARYARAIACCGQSLAEYLAALEREAAELPGDPILERALGQARAEAAGRR